MASLHSRLRVATHSPDPTQPLLAEAAFAHRLARALLRDPDLAQDVAQDALTAALAARRPALQLRAWLAAVTRRLALRARRAERGRPAREAHGARPEADDREARTSARLALHRRLMDAVQALPEPYRTAVTLRYLDGVAPRAIARQCGITAAAARQHVHRGLALLRGRLDREFGDRGSWCSALLAVGLGGAQATPFLAVLPVLMMKPFAVVAVVAVLLTLWALLPGPQSSSPVASAPAVATPAGPGVSAPLPLPAAPSLRVPAVVAANLVLEVVDAAGHPVVDARVHTWRAGGAVVAQRSDDHGCVACALGEGGGVLVQASGHEPLLQALANGAGTQRLVLPAGATVAGVMLEDGVPAPAGLRLTLRGAASAAVPTALAPLPPAIADLLVEWRPSSTTWTDAAGRFAFVGVRSGWSGTLETPQTHWLLPQSGVDVDDNVRRLALREPRPDLVLATTRLPGVSGRVVWDDADLPVARPSLMAWCRFADGTDSPSLGITGGDDGRFAVGFHPGSSARSSAWLEPARRSAVQRVELDVRAEGSDGATHVVLAGETLARPEALVVRLRRAPPTQYLALGVAGTPVAGARVLSQGVSAPTGADGRGTFRGPLDQALVGAPGHMVVRAMPRASAAGTAADPLVFVLPADNTLTLRLRDAAGAVPAATRVVVYSTEGDLFAGRRFQSELDRLLGSSEAGGTRVGRQEPDGTTVWREWATSVVPDAQGEAILHALEPGIACAVVVRDALEQELLRREFTTPTAGAALHLDLLVTQPPRLVRGQVRDDRGQPVAGAEVALGDGRREVATSTDGDGRFALAPVYGAGPLRARVRARGLVAQERALGADERDLEFRLGPGHTVTVRVVDTTGALVGLAAWPEGADHARLPAHAQELQPGATRWSELPAGAVTFACELGGQRFRVQHDTAHPEATLLVPRPARVVVALPPGWPGPVDNLLVLATRGDTDAPRAVALAVATSDARAALVCPGRYRMVLVRRTWDGQPRQPRDVPLGPAAEVTLGAGELAQVQLR